MTVLRVVSETIQLNSDDWQSNSDTADQFLMMNRIDNHIQWIKFSYKKICGQNRSKLDKNYHWCKQFFMLQKSQ